jgi:fatty-acyl-CoA synthase
MALLDLLPKHILERARKLFPDEEIVTRLPDGEMHRYTYGELYERSSQLAHALDDLGVDHGTPVGGGAMSHYRFGELYFAPGCTGRPIHYLNVAHPAETLAELIPSIGDGVLFVDPPFVEKFESIAGQLKDVDQYVIFSDTVPETSLEPVVSYEAFIDGYPTDYDWPNLEESDTFAIGHTSGTTGLPKNIEATQRSVYLHTLTAGHVDGYRVSQSDTVLPLIPMSYPTVAGMGPYSTALAGATFVSVGTEAFLSGGVETFVELIEQEGATRTMTSAATWHDILLYLDEHPDAEISSLDDIVIGGEAPPKVDLERSQREYDINIVHGMGPAETMGMATLNRPTGEMEQSDDDTFFEFKTRQGQTLPGVDFQVLDEDGEPVPWDDDTIGELLLRGLWMQEEYMGLPERTAESFTGDGWLKMDDMARVSPEGYIKVVDRRKHIVTSAGEWISTSEQENELKSHDLVDAAAVVGIPHDDYGERPIAVVVLREEPTGSVQELLREHLLQSFPEWWVPDEFVVVDDIPRTPAINKIDKKQLADDYADFKVEVRAEPPT